MIRPVSSANLSSCVTITIVVPSRFNCTSKSMISVPILLSKFPVGSSARITFGCPINALAIATRWALSPGQLRGEMFQAMSQPDLFN